MKSIPENRGPSEPPNNENDAHWAFWQVFWKSSRSTDRFCDAGDYWNCVVAVPVNCCNRLYLPAYVAATCGKFPGSQYHECRGACTANSCIAGCPVRWRYWGVLGALVAVPLAAMVAVLVQQVIAPSIRRHLPPINLSQPMFQSDWLKIIRYFCVSATQKRPGEKDSPLSSV